MTPEPSLAWLEKTGLADVADKVFGGARLDFDEGCRLFRTPETRALFALADWAKRRRHGRKIFYVLNQHINYSNVCKEVCLFCAFGKRKGEDGAFEMSLDEVFLKAERLTRTGATELHIVGGVHPDLPFRYYLDMLRGLKLRHPGVALKCFTAVEIDTFADLIGGSVESVLRQLCDAGLAALPGGGAEIFAEATRKQICPTKSDADRWLDIHRTAHRLGIPSNCTMLYGHVESVEDRVDHLIRLRRLQDESRGFMAYIPLAFHPENTMLAYIPAPQREDHLRQLAAGRLIFDNIDHVKVYWIMAGLQNARAGLHCGADDIDGTVVEEKIYHMAGAQTPQEMSEAELRAIIEGEGLEPVRRDCLYREAPAAAGAATA